MSGGEEPIASETATATDAATSETATEAALGAPQAAARATAPAPKRRRGIRRFFGRFFAPFGRIPHPPLRSRRGFFILVVLVAGFGSAMTVGGVVAISWTETADFCGRCHSMEPELKAYAMSPHREVPCAECHVEPGVSGWIKAKINGTRQLFLVLTGGFPKPIPPPDHADLPPTSATCVQCHDVETLIANGGPVKLVLTARYRKDESNTRDSIALVLRPAGFGGTSETRGVHWHIDSDVEYTSQDPRARKIDWVGIQGKDGSYEQYIAASEIGVSSDVQPDIDRLKAESTVRRMNCIDCHNRVGHGISTTDQAIDAAITGGQVDQSLPYIKREASDRMSIPYASVADADAAIAGIQGFYEAEYPLLPKLKQDEIDKAIKDLQRIYRLVATPEMQVTAVTYPNNLGHQSAPGCFRCHDGAHYKVVDGSVTRDTIPATCATCHTFPQIGAIESGVLIGQRPSSHDDRLWVFNHKTSVKTADPTDTTCGACHTRTYCENCHSTPAAKVPHDDMVFNHAKVIVKIGAQACAACHVPVYCAQCHADPVLPDPFPDQSLEPSPSPASP
jgi:nitrate/TMAO reductase-like tetraheme cytochrome c subunit